MIKVLQSQHRPEPSRERFPRSRGGVEKAALASDHRPPDLFLKIKGRPCSSRKPIVHAMKGSLDAGGSSPRRRRRSLGGA
jgi:hypothetical protein